jgi:hypothetical protein
MDINQLRTTRAMALRQRTACTLVPGLGYIRLGEVNMPDRIIFPPSACTPPDETPDMTLFDFIPPGATLPSVKMHWLADDRLWQPLSITAGNRMAYRPAFLAAHGWKLADG